LQQGEDKKRKHEPENRVEEEHNGKRRSERTKGSVKSYRDMLMGKEYGNKDIGG
tara:strand:+ start:767 stop:928 length:162 start_codon:yes stop_codon:yes gene_type:complete